MQDKIDNRKNDLLQFNIGNDDQIAILKEEKKVLKGRLKKNDIADVDKTNFTDRQYNFTTELNGIMDRRKEIGNNLKVLRAEAKAYKNSFIDEYNKRTWGSRLIQNKKESVLKEIEADQGASHVGDLLYQAILSLSISSSFIIFSLSMLSSTLGKCATYHTKLYPVCPCSVVRYVNVLRTIPNCMKEC